MSFRTTSMLMQYANVHANTLWVQKISQSFHQAAIKLIAIWKWLTSWHLRWNVNTTNLFCSGRRWDSSQRTASAPSPSSGPVSARTPLLFVQRSQQFLQVPSSLSLSPPASTSSRLLGISSTDTIQNVYRDAGWSWWTELAELLSSRPPRAFTTNCRCCYVTALLAVLLATS